MKSLIVKLLFCFTFCIYNIFSLAQITKQDANILLTDSAINTGHIGICIYEPATNTYWYKYNDTKYFIPASNTKLFTLYAGMKYLGDSLVGVYYFFKHDDDNKNKLFVIGNGDPTFLHPRFKQQPVLDFLKNNLSNEINLVELMHTTPNKQKLFAPYGKGWCWDDYSSSDMAERNFFPMYGNVATFNLVNNKIVVAPHYFSAYTTNFKQSLNLFTVERLKESNNFFVHLDSLNKKTVEIPIKFSSDTSGYSVEDSLLTDTLKQKIKYATIQTSSLKMFKKIYSQPTDSLLKPMMQNSNNFFAEQILLMVSNQYLGYMGDENIIDTLLNTDLKDAPQKPKWVDGSGLSRYNLFSAQDFVYILNKMKNEFGFARMKNILATGGQGTLLNYYKKDSGYIFAKTGTLSNNCALSGYLITNKGKLLIFSILNNNYITSATPIRKAVEQFLVNIKEKY